MFFDSLLDAINEFGTPTTPLWIVLLGHITEFSESKWLLMQSIEKITLLTTSGVKPYAKTVSKFIYNLILLEERLRGGERVGEELADLLYQCYQFIRSSYFDFDLKKQTPHFDPVSLLGKALRSEKLCRAFKSLAIEIVAMVKMRLGKLLPETAVVESFLMLVRRKL